MGTYGFDVTDANGDSGLAAYADLDVATQEEQEAQLGFDERRFILEEAVRKHPRNREVLYKILALCRQERSLTEIEEKVAEFPEFSLCTLSQHELVRVLECAYGLSCIERDADGVQVDAARKEGLSQDQVDDLVASYGYVTTSEGLALVEQHDPLARIAELIGDHPAQAEVTLGLLRYVHEEPRTYLQVQKRLAGDPALVVESDGHRTTLQPSVILDRLSRAGAIVFQDGWRATEAGERYLDENDRVEGES